MLMGDSTDGIQGIPKVGPKTAETWLEDIDRDKMPTFVLNKYIEKFGISEGIAPRLLLQFLLFHSYNVFLYFDTIHLYQDCILLSFQTDLYEK